jgi:ATP-dependent Clp protease ATP-binding subunit ClpC
MSTSSGDPLPSFSELINELLGLPPGAAPPQVRGTPLGDLLNGHAHKLVHEAAKRVHEDGSPQLSASHLLWAATKVDPSRSLFRRVSVDPDVVAMEIDKVLPGPPEAGSKPVERGLSPEASHVIGLAQERAQETGSSLVGPEHILDALLTQPSSGVVVMLDDGAVDIRRLRMFAESDELRFNDADD